MRARVRGVKFTVWQRRSELEIVKIKRDLKRERFSPVVPLVLSFVVTPFIMITITIFGTRYNKPFERLDQIFFDSGVMCLILFSFIYLLQIAGKRGLLDEASGLFCEDCQRYFDLDTKLCECGKKLEPFEFYEKHET